MKEYVVMNKNGEVINYEPITLEVAEEIAIEYSGKIFRLVVMEV